MKKLKHITLTIILFSSIHVQSQTNGPIGRALFEQVEVDVIHGIITSNKVLPFDVPFIFHGRIPSNVISIKVYYKDITNKSNSSMCGYSDTVEYDSVCEWMLNFFNKKNDSNDFYITMPPLKPNHVYNFYFKLKTTYSKDDIVILNSLSREKLYDGVVEEVKKINLTKTDLAQINLDNLKNTIRKNFHLNLSDIICKKYGKYETVSMRIKSDNILYNELIDWRLLTANIMRIRFYSKQYQLFPLEPKMIKLSSFLKNLSKQFANKTLSDEGKSFIAKIKLLEGTSGIDNSIQGILNFNTLNRSSINVLFTELSKENIKEISDNIKILNDSVNQFIKTDFKNLSKTQIDSLKLLISNTTRELNYLENLDIELTKLENYTDTVSVEEYLSPFDIQLPFIGNTTADFKTRAEYYITADIGIAAMLTSNIDALQPYAGVNFNLSPINRQARYKLNYYKKYNYNLWDILYRKSSIIVGVTFNSVGKTVNGIEIRKGIVGINNSTGGLLTGLAFRLGDYGRISGGFIFLNEHDTNLLIDKYYLQAYPFISLSLDLDVKANLGSLAKLISPSE